jgi:hypothetical protein
METSRRVFLGTSLVTGATLAAPLAGFENVFAQGRRGDPVLEELVAQSKAAAQRAAGLIPSGEGARHGANVIRLFVAHGVGDEITKHLRAAVAQDGRERFLARRPETAAFAQTLGVKLPVLPLLADNYAVRSAALESILKNGVAASLLSVASGLEELAANIDRTRGIQVVRQSAADCASGQWALFMLEITMIGACGPWAGPALAASCGIATAMYLTYLLSLSIMGCL